MAGVPKSTHLLRIAGNPSKRPLRKEATASLADANINPPEHLCEVAKDVWRVKLPEVVTGKTCAPADLDVLAVYCEAVATIRIETVAINSEGSTFEGPHGPVCSPRVKVRADAVSRMLRCAAVLGIGQSNRQKLTPIESGGKDDDSLEAFNRKFG